MFVNTFWETLYPEKQEEKAASLLLLLFLYFGSLVRSPGDPGASDSCTSDHCDTMIGVPVGLLPGLL